MLRAASHLDADVRIISLNGHSGYDTISRAAFMHKLREVAPALVPFIRMWYGQESTYTTGGTVPTPGGASTRREGCEEGDALAPALCTLGQHDARVAADERLQTRNIQKPSTPNLST